MGTATLIITLAAAPIPVKRTNHGGVSSCPMCTGCQRSRSLIGMKIKTGSTTWKSSSGIHQRTTATAIQ
ncbi:hypothetical protein CRUP_003800, partial [Coryphaenoides rupestris]